MKQQNSLVNVVRCFFIFSVVAAHSAIPIESLSENLLVSVIRNLWDIISIYGVAGFFIISGYLYTFEKRTLKDIMFRKWKSIVVPWLFCGLLIYMLCQYNLQTSTLLFLVKFVLGYGSYLYYLPILFSMYIIFYFIKDSNFFICLGIGLGVLSIVLTQLQIYTPLFTDFLNIFNWIVYFAFGILVGKLNLLERIKSKTVMLISLVLTIILVTIDYYLDVKTYFNIMALFTNLTVVCFFFSVCSTEKINKNRFLNTIGNYSFSIYLLHMPVVSTIKHIVKIVNPELYIFIPLIVILVFVICINILMNTINKYQKLEFVKVLLGLR